jgi:hypothetical protein
MSEDHWTENEDTLARFVLSKMNAAERAPLEEHLRTCEICKQAVRTEQQLASGARRLGRDELKGRLRGRVGASAEFPWLRVAGVAAAIVILVSIGVYNRWFMTQQTQEVSNQIAQQSESLSERKIEQNQAVQIVPSQPQELPREARGKKQEAKSAPTSKEAEQKLAQPLAAAPEPSKELGADIKVQALDKAMSADHAAAQEIWVNGNVLPSNAAPLEEAAGERKDDRAQTMMKAQRNEAAVAGQPPMATLQLNGQTLILRQQSLDSLPATQQGFSPTRAIPTKMKLSNETLELTLYLDTPLDEAELLSATIQPVSDDSILINFPRRRIAYRVPLEWGAKLRTATQQR